MFLTTGPSATVRAGIAERSGGLCERCGCARAEVIHHRRPRAAGGSKRADTNGFPNLLHICNECHLWVESLRTRAGDNGWLVEQGHVPADEPVLYRGALVWLRDDGGVDPVEFDE